MVRTPENEAVWNAVEQSPRRSAVRHMQTLRLSDTTVRRILHQDLNFHPYKLMLVQELNQQDFGRRTTFAETMWQMFDEDPELVILTSDEAHFHLNRSVNKQNFVVCFLLSDSPASEIYMLTFRNTLSVPSSYAGRYV